MTCSIPHDNCPLFEEAEDHLACLDLHCCWTYVNPTSTPPRSGPMGRNRDWEAEYDRRLDDPAVPKDKMKNWRVGSEIRVADDDGVMRRRNGAVCCGCGKGRHGDAADPASVDLDRPKFNDDDDGGSPKLFLGIF